MKNKAQCQLCKRLAEPFIPLSWSRKGFHFGCDHYGAAISHFLVYWAIFGMVASNKQPGDPSVSLHLTSEKAVFCNMMVVIVMMMMIVMTAMMMMVVMNG